MEHDSYTDAEIRDILSLRHVVVVGMSKNDYKAAHYVPKYLSENGFDITPVNPTTDEILGKKCYSGFDITPVNPTTDEILGKKCYSTISDVVDDIDIVDVFRPSDLVLPVVKEAIKKNPKVIWLQEGIHNPEAEDMARKKGIKVVFNRCMLAEHQRLF